MKNVYFGIKYHADHRNRETVEQFERCFSSQGFTSYCVARDMEKWGAYSFSAQELMQSTFRRIDTADLVVLDVSEKGVGLGIEAGYAKAKGKYLIVTLREGQELSTTMRGIADQIIEYKHIASIRIELP